MKQKDQCFSNVTVPAVACTWGLLCTGNKWHWHSFASDNAKRKGWSGILKAREEKVEGNTSCNHQMVSQCVDTDN